MKFECTEVFNFEGALRGMRNPMNSHRKSDSGWGLTINGLTTDFIIGENDLKLAQKLIRSGSEHRKFMRQIFVCVDITAPLFWWKEFDTYKVGTTANSESTMHKIHAKPITIGSFEAGDYSCVFKESEMSFDSLIFEFMELQKELIDYLEALRLKFLETKDIQLWEELIRWLPESWLQKRTVTMTYENILAMLRQRKNHKLKEWSANFINWANELPYAKELLFIE